MKFSNLYANCCSFGYLFAIFVLTTGQSWQKFDCSGGPSKMQEDHVRVSFWTQNWRDKREISVAYM